MSRKMVNTIEIANTILTTSKYVTGDHITIASIFLSRVDTL